MGFLDWLGISARDAPPVTDSVRDSGQTFVFGKADSGEKVDEKSAMQIATVYACVRLLAETVAGLPLHLYRFSDEAEKDTLPAAQSGDDELLLPGNHDDAPAPLGQCLRPDHPGRQE